jgi:ComF family protein
MAARLRVLAHHTLYTLRDFFLPPRCVSCQVAGTYFCPVCQAALSQPAAREVPPLDGLHTVASYQGPAQDAVHALKYEGKRPLAWLLAKPMAALLRATGWPITVITAVPMHAAHQAERGYNQAALLAEALAKQMHVPFEEEILIRQRETASQVGLNAQERWQNVAEAFQASDVRGQVVLVVDDVATTGATLAACASALKKAEASHVFALTFASTPLHSEPSASVPSTGR